ncbi:MAG: biotin transporter BioY [Lachnospiraceae bacterium]|nr:biotin transporter BioY [Lachnospiraceae bacterium]
MANSKPQQLALTGLAAAFICIFGPLILPIPISPVPISLCTLAIYFCGYLLGSKCAVVSVLIYLLIGFLGVPVFSGFTSGPGHLLGPTGGYLIGYLLLALICGQSRGKSRSHLLVSCLTGTIICYALGTLWLALQNQLSLPTACMAGVVPFLIGDFVKLFIVTIAGPGIYKRLQL